jgi:hypothetical protein
MHTKKCTSVELFIPLIASLSLVVAVSFSLEKKQGIEAALGIGTNTK